MTSPAEFGMPTSVPAGIVCPVLSIMVHVVAALAGLPLSGGICMMDEP
jgi:hypothetical protein